MTDTKEMTPITVLHEFTCFDGNTIRISAREWRSDQVLEIVATENGQVKKIRMRPEDIEALQTALFRASIDVAGFVAPKEETAPATPEVF